MRRFRFKPLPLTGAIMSALLGLHGPRALAQSLPANALPTNGQVVSGAGSITQSGNAMQVTQGSQRLVTHWDTFNIGSAARVEFVQPSASAVALNRVLSGDPSRIYGQLSANGQVFLVNPAGVLFGAGARVNVGGLVASTLDISDDDFHSGRRRFAGNSKASVVNEGQIEAARGGTVALLGAQVRNSGSITAPMGSIVLAAAPAVTLDLHGDGLLSVQLDGATAEALAANAGALRADGGLVMLAARGLDPMATAVNNTGTVHATTLSNRNGVIRLEGGDAGVVRSSGLLDASGRGVGETGGTVTVLGDKVGLFDGARIDASGEQGGGTILVGGNWQGSGSERRASASYVAADARLQADATGAGDGGKVVVWSDGTTRFGGIISARGAGEQGRAGLAEVSGKSFLDFNGFADLGAQSGQVGSLLLDPTNITISTGGNTAVLTGEEFAGSGASAVLNVTTLQNQLANSNVTVSTASAGGSAGDITVANSVTYSGAAARTLTLRANRDITLNTNVAITATTGPLSVVLNSGAAAAGSAGSVTLASGAKVISNGGDITIGGGPGAATAATGGGGTSNGFRMQGGGTGEATGALLSAGAGNITIRAASPTASGVTLQSSGFSTITTTSGNITITSTGGTNGINVTTGTNTIRTTSGNITLTGTATGSGTGVTFGGSSTNSVLTDSGAISINGTSVTGIGAAMTSGTNLIRANTTGNVTITGQSTGGTGSYGVNLGTSASGGTNTVQVADGALVINAQAAGTRAALSMGSVTNRVQATGNGSVSITAATTGSSNGLAMGSSGNNAISTASGNVSIVATATGGGNGVSIATGTNLIEAGGSGNVSVQGSATSTVEGLGVSIGTGGTNAIRTANGSLAVRGQSAGSESAASLGSGTNTLEVTGAGSLTLEGVAARSNGVSLAAGGMNTVRTTTGALTINGTGGGSTGDGVVLGNGTITVQTTTGALAINGTATGSAMGVLADTNGSASVLTQTGNMTITGASAGDTALAFNPDGGTVRFEASGPGNISLRGDSYDATPAAGGTVRIASAGGVLGIEQLTPGTTIGVGDGAIGGLQWSAAEIGQVQGFSLVRLGNAASGAVDVRPPWFSFPVERPPASRSAQQQRLDSIFAVIQEWPQDDADAAGFAARPGRSTSRMRLVIEGFDDERKK